MHQFPVLFGFHSYLRQQVFLQIQRQPLGIVAIRLLDRLADHLELVRVHYHHPPHSSHHRIVEARRRPHGFHRHLVLLAQLFHELFQLPAPPLPYLLLPVFPPCAYYKLRAMQIHSQIAFHPRLSLYGSGVDAALRRSPHSHPSSYWLTVTLRSAGLTNLRVEVVLPHCTSTACNLSAPDFLSWSIPPQNLHSYSCHLRGEIFVCGDEGRFRRFRQLRHE